MQPGDVLAGKYRVERVIGAGGMGVVVAATHLQLGELVALKFLLPASLAHAETVARFLREARAAARIKSEHVARVSDVGPRENGAPYIVWEHREGRDLSALLEQDGPLSPELAITYVLQACEAIAEAHALGIVHRDLKPSNLFVARRIDGAPIVKVLDFGIAKADAPDGGADVVTATNTTMGSPRYMSPEQVRSARRVDQRSDLWSLGVILHELVAGEPPFTGESPASLLATVVMDEPARLRDARPDAPEELERVVLRCLEKDPADRYADVGELARALGPLAPGARASVELISRVCGAHPDDQVPERARLEAERSPGRLRLRAREPATLDQNAVATARDTTQPPATDDTARAAARPRRIAPLVVAGVLFAGAVVAFAATRGERAAAEPAPASRDPAATHGEPPAPAKSEAPVAPSEAPVVVPVSSATTAPSPLPIARPRPGIAASPAKPAHPSPPADRRGSDRH
ncbi:MAG: protein kinase [Polyangiaceae bacterium]|nr:protein kinase [Polyangiaceae bacterium]